MAKPTLRLRDWLLEGKSPEANSADAASTGALPPEQGEEDWSALFADESNMTMEEGEIFSPEPSAFSAHEERPSTPASTINRPSSNVGASNSTNRDAAVIPHPFGLPENLFSTPTQPPSPPSQPSTPLGTAPVDMHTAQPTFESTTPPPFLNGEVEALSEWEVTGPEGLPHSLDGLVSAFVQQLIALLLAIHRGEIIPRGAFLPVVDQLLTLLDEHPDQIQALEQILLENPIAHLTASSEHRERDQVIMEDLALHHLNVTFYVYKVGLGLLDSSSLHLAVRAAAVHDLGMARLPVGLLVEQGVFSQQQREMMQLHPLETQDLVRMIYPDEPMLADLVVQEQERFNGSGYPTHLTGEAIHPIARLIGLIDTFEAMIHPRPYRKRLLPVEAVQRIVRELKGVFDPRQVKALINNISVFPMGTYVQLNTKEIGRVVQTHRESPLRPKIEVLYNEAKQKLSIPRTIELSRTPLIFITKSLYPEDVEVNIHGG